MGKIRAVQYGVGKMSVYTMRYMIEQGIEIVGAIDINPVIVGKSINEILIRDDLSDIIITDAKNARETLEKLKPDICIVTTRSLLSEVEEPLLICAELGINAITSCEEAFYPMNSNPNLTRKIDELAKKNNCTITGTGYQDVFWGNLVTSIAASTHKISKITGVSSYNVEEYGLALAESHGAGLTLAEFNSKFASEYILSDKQISERINNGTFKPSYMWNVNGWICDKLGFTVKSQTQKCFPRTNKQDIYSSTLNMTIKSGDVIGMSSIVTTETEEGIVIETECIGKVYDLNEFDVNTWTIYGEPTTTFNIDRPDTVELTCATLINRIPDVIKSRSGYVTTNEFDEIKFRKEIEN